MPIEKKTVVKTQKTVYEFEVEFKINKTVKVIEYSTPDYKKVGEIESGIFKFRSDDLKEVRKLSHGILSLIKLGERNG